MRAKYSLIFILLLFGMLCFGIFAILYNNDKNKNSSWERNADIGLYYKVIVIDSCEYIITPSYTYSGITHKGNCKFCEERNKQH